MQSTHAREQQTNDELCRLAMRDPGVASRQLKGGAQLSLGDENDSYTVVVAGAVTVEAKVRGGRRVVLEVLGPTACLPPVEALRTGAAPLVLTALMTSTIARVPRSVLNRLVLQNPFLATLMGAKLSTQYGELVARFIAHEDRSPSRRLAETLVYLAPRLGQRCSLASGARIVLPQHTIAKVADLSRQTANRCLGKVQAMGLVRVERGMVCILDTAGLEAVAAGAAMTPVWKPAGPCKLNHPTEPLTCYPLRRAPSRTARQKRSLM